MACAKVSGCPLFKAFTMKSSLQVWKSYYCEGDFSRCERFKLSSCGKPVGLTLLPNGRTLEVPLEQLEARHLL
jgi:hypothetical protein